MYTLSYAVRTILKAFSFQFLPQFEPRNPWLNVCIIDLSLCRVFKVTIHACRTWNISCMMDSGFMLFPFICFKLLYIIGKQNVDVVQPTLIGINTLGDGPSRKGQGVVPEAAGGSQLKLCGSRPCQGMFSVSTHFHMIDAKHIKAIENPKLSIIE